MGLTQFQGGDIPFQLLQNSWASEIDPILKNPLLRGVFQKDISLVYGTNKISTLLGRNYLGYLITGLRPTNTTTIDGIGQDFSGTIINSLNAAFTFYRYITLGASVFITAFITWTGNGTTASTLEITTPFNLRTGDTSACAGAAYFLSGGGGTTRPATMRFSSNNLIFASTLTSSPLKGSDFVSSDFLTFSGIYESNNGASAIQPFIFEQTSSDKSKFLNLFSSSSAKVDLYIF